MTTCYRWLWWIIAIPPSGTDSSGRRHGRRHRSILNQLNLLFPLLRKHRTSTTIPGDFVIDHHTGSIELWLFLHIGHEYADSGEHYTDNDSNTNQHTDKEHWEIGRAEAIGALRSCDNLLGRGRRWRYWSSRGESLIWRHCLPVEFLFVDLLFQPWIRILSHT